jgi:hypothetical protein
VAPLNIHTKVGELKVQMVADTSRDARNPAEPMANQAKARVTSPINAKMSVLQIDPA